jgi:hypothetical protein
MFSVELLLIDTAPGSSESTDGIRGPWDLGLAPKGYCRASISHRGGTSLFTGLTCKRAVGPRCHEVDFDHPHGYFFVFYPLLGA